MATKNYLGNGIVGDNTGKGIVGSNTGKGIVGNGGGNSTENVGNIYMHPPYAVIVEPRDEGGNVTQGNKNYQETLNAYNAAKSKLINATDEAATLRNSWSAPPRVALENGKLNLYGTDDFLKSNEAKQLLEIFKTMEGSTYNTEKLNQQIEAWNSALQKMSEGYNDAVDQMNQVNNAILTTAKNPNPHLLTFSEMQKIGNSAAIGKQPDARTSKSKIFVGYEWDDDGNMKEKWVEAKEVFKEFDKISSDKKRSAYHALMTQANNGDVAAYSKLLYLQGGSEGGPANVDYDKTVGDFFNTLGNNILMNLGGFAQGVFDYARFFNVGQITANLSDYAEYFDQRDFWDLAAAVLTPGLYADQYDSRGEISRTVKNAVEDYSAAVSWENAFFSELTPGSTGAASTIGGVTGAALGMAFHLYSSGVGQKVMAGDKYSQGIVTNAINKANEALISTGKFVPYEIRLGRVKIKTDTIGTPLADGGGIIGRTTNAQKVYEAMASSGVYAVPTIIAKNFPNIAEAMGYAALVKNGGIGAVLSGSGKGTSLLETTVSGGVRGGYFSDTSHTFATTFGNIIENGKTYNALFKYADAAGLNFKPNTGALGSVTEKAMWNMVAKGFRTAQTLIPLTGFAAARNADEYLKRVKAGEDLGDMTEYIISNTAKDVAFGGALMGAGAVVGKIRAMAKAGRVSPADAASSTFATDFGTQGGFYQPESPYYQKRLAPGNLNADEMASLQRTMSEIMTVNNEVFAGAPTNNGAMTSALPGTYVEGAARTFGAMSPRKAFKYSVEETFDGAYLVTETTDLDTNTKVTTREFRNSVAEAEKEISEKSIPSTSPKTLANNDQVNNIKVAPLTVDGKAPATMPEGVSQVKFEPGTVYRTPDGLADEIAGLVEKAGGSFEAVELAYQEAVEYVANNMDEPAPEAPFLPERLSSDFTLEDRELLRAAAWAKAHGYNAIPLRVPTSYSRTIKKFSMPERVRADETKITPNNIVGMQYGVPYKYFTNESDALAWAKEEGGRAVHKLDDNADILTRPPVTTDDLAENPLLLGAGEGYIPHVERFDELMTTLPTLMEEGEGAVDYLRGIVDIVREVNAVYTAVAANVNLDDIYSRYAKAIYDDEEVALTPDEKKALEPITHMLDALGHYFDPSGKSLTQEFYLPTALAANKMVNIEKALLKGEDVDLEHPVDTGFNDILLDLQRIGDAGFWQKRTGDLFRDEDGNFTMARAGTLQDALTSYTVSALTRGKNSLAVAVNNEVAKSKYDRNRSQITEKQAYAGIKEADKIRGKTKSYRAAISKDADKIAELKEDYDESAVDQAMKAKNYSKDLGFVKSTNHAAQLLGYNQFLEMTPIQGSVIRYGTQGQVYRGTTNIRRKMEKINITGPMWVTRFGAKQRIGFGLEASEANTKKYGVFKAGEPAVNLGRIVSMSFDSDINALAYLYTLKGVIKAWSTGDGMDMVTAVNKYARENFPLLDDYEWNAAKLLKELARNYHASTDPMAVDAMNVDSISKWIRNCTATCFNNAIMMTDISNLDDRTLEALDEAAAYIYVGSPLKRNKIVNGVLKWESVAKLGGNVSPMLGNIVSEIFTRLPGYIGWKDTTRALKRALDTKESARINNIISDLPSHYDSPEDDTILQTAKKLFGTVTDKATGAALKPLTWSEKVKNLVYYAAGEINAERKGITDPAKKQLEAIRFVGEHAIAGGKGTTPGVAESSLARTLFLFRTFTIRNFDDFIDFVEKASRGETGDNYWDAKYEKKYGKNNKDRSGRNKASFKLGAKAVGGRLMRSYVIWLTILSYFGKSFMDALGGDPTGITDGGKDRGLYDDEDTEEYEGMTDFDNFINSLPAGVIFGSLQDLYFAARRRGVDSKQFMAFDLWNDQKLNNDMSKHLPLGVAYNRFADMLDLLDRGYSFSSTGKKTYAAPETALDVVKGFLFGKSTTENSLAYGKYRYGTVNIWGDLSSGDWMDFAMNANPLKDITGSNAQFDTTRKNYTGVFDGSWNDIATMQLIIAQFKERQQTIIDDYNRDKYRYGGDYEGLTDAEKVAKAKETREKKIDAYTEDIQRAVNAFTSAGNALSDKQISNLMYLFDFHEGEEDDEWNSSTARERYVEAGLPDYNAAAIQRTTKTENGEKKDVTKNYLDRSLILQNAQQGFYGSSKKAANAVKEALSGFDSTYKAYKERVKALNDKYFAAREKNKKSAETKQLSKDLEKLQNEYIDKLYQQLTPVVEQYGTALIGTYDVADVLQDYMNNMIPYSSIKKYGQTYSSGNDIVYGQLAEWLQKRWGRNAPTAPSDKEVTNGISEIKKLLDQGKTAAAKSKARAILEKIGRGSLGARRYDVETLRDVAYD